MITVRISLLSPLTQLTVPSYRHGNTWWEQDRSMSIYMTPFTNIGIERWKCVQHQASPNILSLLGEGFRDHLMTLLGNTCTSATRELSREPTDWYLYNGRWDSDKWNMRTWGIASKWIEEGIVNQVYKDLCSYNIRLLEQVRLSNYKWSEALFHLN